MAAQKTKSFTVIGLIVLIVLFLVVNMVSSTLFTNTRIDLTENELYTLTDGTRNIIKNIEEPVTMYLFYSDKASEDVPQLRTYATRVKELLKEYEQLSNGNIVLNIVDPLPFSEEEDQAGSFGLQAIPVGATGENVYFGLAASNAVGDTEVLPFFQPQREQFLEYDVSKLLSTLSNPKKTVVGVITQLSIFGGFDMQTTQMTKAWALIAQMRQLFEVKQLDVTADLIDADVDILMVVHPKTLTEPTQYAIDQFVMRGGKAIFFVDPHSEVDIPVKQQNSPLEVEGGRTSNLKKLFDAWGIDYDPTKVVLDRKYALTVGGAHQGQSRHYGLLAVTKEDIDADDVISSELEVISAGVSGFIKAKEGADIKVIPIVTSSDDSALIDASKFRFLPDLNQLSNGFEPTGEKYILSARVEGKLNTAFKNGRPAMSDAKKVDDSKYGEHLESTKENANLIIFADTDMLSDRMWVQVQDFFGQQIFNSWANNGDLIINAIDNLTGTSDLISIRGRETSTRPFERVNDLRLAADQKFRSTEEKLQAQLAETEAKLVELQKARDDGDELMLSPEQEAEIEKFQQDKFKVRKELRQVRHNLDLDIEKLGSKLKFINIGLVPIIISILALLISFIRSRKRKRALGV
ncbi:MAG: Gldg family protein [Gammaproteobacteria bacterium]|nr:Gldg family protein [Gammaproteobacteria bacterium]